MKYIKPERGVNSFTCPHCGVLARQRHKSSPDELNGNYSYSNSHRVCLTRCDSCGDFSLWHFDKMVFPKIGLAPQPNPDLPDEVKTDYLEAASISNLSPKGAAALLRLAIQKLCVHLGGDGSNINNDIKTLVENGLPPKIQKSLDIVRVIGNNAVHPGQIDTDNPEVVGNLFMLINIIAETMITVPNQIDSLYGELPEGARDAIQRRDS
ncbi:DUF4145 domain-containing protein [Motiliproteus sp.]|uniref:DUF4145 domain-containing protein n=1 Tax=Motiliproteus sp. TaxID=1898955 RepID=UPI003BAC51BA